MVYNSSMEDNTRKKVRFSALHQAFQAAGFDMTAWALYTRMRRWEKAGKFSPLRDPFSGHRVFYESEIPDIVTAFSPGGAGTWASTFQVGSTYQPVADPLVGQADVPQAG